ncbi:11491_t:CDS:2, partial [Funneliformis geosporum]
KFNEVLSRLKWKKILFANTFLEPVTHVQEPKRGQQIYQRAYTTNSSFPKANKFLFDVNTKFDYNSNFEGTFFYTFCSAYNSKFQHLRHEDKITSQQDNELSASGISSNEKETDNNDTDGIEE